MHVLKQFAGSTALAAVLLLAISPIIDGAAGEPDPQGIAGMYDCHGVLPGGAKYSGSVDIVRHGDTLQLLWTLSSGERYVGVGIASGDVLAVTYFADIPGVRVENWTRP